MKYVSLILSSILRIFLIFFLTFIWTRYFLKELWLSLLISAVVTSVLDVSIRFLLRKKSNKNNLKLKEKEEAENMFLSLATSANYLTFFHELAKKENPSAEKKDKYILLKNSDRTVLLYPFMSMNELSKDDIAKILISSQKQKANKLVIVCGELAKDTFAFSKSLGKEILLLDKFSAYSELYKFYGFFPEISLTYQKNKKLALKELFAFSFNKSRTKGYFLSAIILFISTLFIRMNIYYCIMASLLIVFALISYFNPYFNVKQNKVVLRN